MGQHHGEDVIGNSPNIQELSGNGSVEMIDYRSGSGTKCFVKHDHMLVAHSG